MNVDDIQLKFAKYRISKFELVIPGYSKPYVVDPAHIGNWTIEKDYENYLFPYLEFRCVVPDKVYADVMDNSEEVYVDLKIEYGLFDDMYEMDPKDAINMFGPILENRFYAFIANKSPKMTDDTAGERKKEAMSAGPDDLTQYSYDNNRALVMGLYRADHIFNTNRVINAILSGATVSDAVAYYFKKLGLKDVLMSPSDNSKRYDQLALPPLPAAKGLMRMVNTYGLHKAGTTVFFDYDMIYILDKKLGATAWINNEIKTVYLTSFPNRSDQLIMKSGFYANGKEKYCVINIVGNSLSVQNDAMFADQLSGGNIISIDSNTGKITNLTSNVNVSKMSPSKAGAVNRVVVQNEGSATVDRAKTEIEQSQNTLSITVQDVNIRALSPNKDFIFTTDSAKYQKYAGHYRITNSTAVFTKESTMYTCMCTATFVGGKATI